MPFITEYPVVVLLFSVAVLCFSTGVGAVMLRKRPELDESAREDFNVVLGGVLTLLGLVIGFSFSMAVARYDQRKACEENEANAIGTEYLRIDLLPAAEAARTRMLLRSYLDQRVLYYTTRDGAALDQVNARSAELQNAMWAVVKGVGGAQPTPVVALVVSGMNDVLNTQGYSQAARTNRIPGGVWLLMLTLAVCGTVLVGYGARNAKGRLPLLVVLPVVVSLSLFLIADIDSPSGGIIRVLPQNLNLAVDSMRTP
jgi:hypothetical protein